MSAWWPSFCRSNCFLSRTLSQRWGLTTRIGEWWAQVISQPWLHAAGCHVSTDNLFLWSRLSIFCCCRWHVVLTRWDSGPCAHYDRCRSHQCGGRGHQLVPSPVSRTRREIDVQYIPIWSRRHWKNGMVVNLSIILLKLEAIANMAA